MFAESGAFIVAVDAFTSLGNVLGELPSSIQFVVARLLEQSNALAPRIARLLDEGYTATQSVRHLGEMIDFPTWDSRSFQLADCG